MKFKKLQKVNLKDGLGFNVDHAKYIGKDAVILDIDGEEITIAIDHDNNPMTPSITITVKAKFINIVGFLINLWSLLKGLFV